MSCGVSNAPTADAAHALRELGVNRGDRVVIFLPNGVEAVIAIFATLKAGGVFVVINSSTKPAKFEHLLDHSGAAAVVAEGKSFVPALLRHGAAMSVKAAVLVGPVPAMQRRFMGVVTIGNRYWIASL